MLKIEMQDLFYGFIRQYYRFGLRPDVNWTKWTNEILAYYADLGKMLGCYVEYEWNRFDLVWFWSLDDVDEDNPWLHIEHENQANRLNELLSRIDNSVSENILVIGYPETEAHLNEFVDDLKERRDTLETRVDVLAILDSECYVEDVVPIHGYWVRGGRNKVEEYRAKKRETADGIYYGYID